ncbi:MAG: hypothetical protein A3H93_01985 [Rhodocyclales bacterium RIFCSPLOWO2_02_FULL_63_24]|nr:MAG: hypothetical protein A3H93_01985 [Rhodocyclales bacterium RIFCSPLOWO2_02_FULL_63_24]
MQPDGIEIKSVSGIQPNGFGFVFVVVSHATVFLPLCTAERGRFAGGSPVALSDDGRFLAG